MKSYRDLSIYIKSRELAIQVHQLSICLPKFEQYEEASQLRRSSKAVTSLIVEGYVRRRYRQDFVKYLTYAHAECNESLVHLDFLKATQSLSDDEKYLHIKREYETLSKSIHRFIQWVEFDMR